MRTMLFLFLLLPVFLNAQEDMTFPVYPGCEGSEQMQDCFTYSVAEQMVKDTGYEVQREDRMDGVIESIKVKCYFTINKKGVAKKISLSGDMDKDLRKKFLKNLKKLPKMKPGSRDGLVNELSFMLPIKIATTE
jgi:hypothetical protein